MDNKGLPVQIQLLQRPNNIAVTTIKIDGLAGFAASSKQIDNFRKKAIIRAYI